MSTGTYTPNKNLIQELRRAESGLDCAGSHEAMHISDYAHDLEKGVPVEQVWFRMCLRYLPNNPDFMQRFVPAAEQDQSDERRMQELEREHMGDPDKKTGIYHQPPQS